MYSKGALCFALEENTKSLLDNVTINFSYVHASAGKEVRALQLGVPIPRRFGIKCFAIRLNMGICLSVCG